MTPNRTSCVVEQRFLGDADWAVTMHKTIVEARQANEHMRRSMPKAVEGCRYRYHVIVRSGGCWPPRAYTYELRPEMDDGGWGYCVMEWRDVEWMRSLQMVERVVAGHLSSGSIMYPPDYGCAELREILVVDKMGLEMGLEFGGDWVSIWLKEYNS